MTNGQHQRYSDYSGLYDDGYDDFVSGKDKRMTKTEELLKVLDLPEDEQLMWLKERREEFGIDNHPSSYPLEGFPRACRFFLADLAFRLRDEAVKTCHYKYDDAIIEVYSVSKKSAEEFHWWWIRHSQPIHVIIAALIAKEMPDDK